MEWQIAIALVVAIPIVLFPAAYVWYLNIGGVVQAVREAKAAREKKTATAKTTS
jgi:hypothetical protein